MYVPNFLWVLFYFDGEALWYAHALNFDLAGSGATPGVAWQELKDAVLTQLAFAVQRMEIDSVERQAPPEYSQMWRDARMITESEIAAEWLDPKLNHAMIVHLDESEIQRAVEEKSFERGQHV
jgi:hypothetical protein